MIVNPCDYISGHMGELFECKSLGNYTRIRTPYLYPDGDVIDLFLSNGEYPVSLTDFGDTLGWLRSQTLAERKTDRQRRLIEDICITHGVELYRGMLITRVLSPNELTEAVSRLSQAAMRASDIWFTFRGRVTGSINEDVEEFLNAESIRFDRNEVLVGRSTRSWRVDFHTRTSSRSTLVNVLSTGSQASARSLVNRVTSMWVDLNHMKAGREGLRFVSLFDDDLDVWRPEDFGLARNVSEVAMWSQKDALRDLLTS